MRGIACPGESFSSDALRLSGVLDFFPFSPGDGFDGDLVGLAVSVTAAALGVDERNGGISVSLSSSSADSNSYDEKPKEMDFFKSDGVLTEEGVLLVDC